MLLDDGTELGYDFPVVATGATHSYFGHEDWAAHAPGLKTLDDRVLPAYPPDLSDKARAQLERLGVEVRTGLKSS